jgi:hypothetical protein
MTEMRRCIGSARFGIQPHDAPIEDFPKQPSQKDGLGRMCKTHWNQYTAGLARDAKARKAAAATTDYESAMPVTEDAGTAEASATPVTDEATPEPAPRRRRAKSATVTDGEEAAG